MDSVISFSEGNLGIIKVLKELEMQRKFCHALTNTESRIQTKLWRR
jgi:hypothetical protein